MDKKKLLIYGGSFVAITTLAVILIFTLKKNKPNSDNPEFAKYINAYTSGIISKSSSIKIELNRTIVEELEKKEKLPEDLFDFSPNVKGEYILAGNFIEFTPAEDLESSTEYFVEFALGKIAKVDSDLEKFTFIFKTITQNFDIRVTKQKTIDKKELKYQQILGVLHTADVETQENISKVLTANQGGNTLKIDWQTDIDGTSHIFTIDSIARKDEKSVVEIRWDGGKIDIDKKGEMEVEIPGKNDFYLISSDVVQQPDQYLQLQFSDPLLENQDLTGLISIQGVEELKYIIEDNTIRVYPEERLSTEKKIKITSGIKNILGYKLNESQSFNIAFEEIKPQVRLTGKGSILPSSEEGLIFPFEAVNLKAVDVTIVKIYENNILQFLQTNSLQTDYDLRRVGKPILKKTIKLDESETMNLGVWNRFTLDLNKLISADPGAIYRITIGFRKQHSTFTCNETDEESEDANLAEEEDLSFNQEAEESNWDNYSENSYDNEYEYYYDENYWENRENPCSSSYYGERRSVSRNIMSSDIGLIYKQCNDGSINVFATDLISAEPKNGVTIELYDYQMQQLKTGITNKDGLCTFEKIEGTFFVVAKNDKQKAYLKVDDGASLSLSQFDIAGTKVNKGLKGFIYGERGVWRPGDTVFVTFVLKESEKALPEGLPITFEVQNPNGQLVKKEIQSKNKTGFYPMQLVTSPESITGNYSLKVSVGAVQFFKDLKIETIKPNRLKMDLDFGKEMIQEGNDIAAKMNVKWLHGAVGKDLKVVIDADLKPVKTSFAKYSDFEFDDPTKEYYSETERVFEGKTDQEGNVNVSASLSTGGAAPGMMKAGFTTKVFEKGGNFSIDQYSVNYSPYQSYTGIKLPKGDKARGMLLTDTTHTVEIVTVSPEGKLITSSQSIELSFYKVEWYWWWDEGSNKVSSYNLQYSAQLISSETVNTVNGKAKWGIRIAYPDWGRYVVIAKNKQTGHTTGKVVYIDWPGWAGRAQGNNAEAAVMLSFSSDKKKYNVGEKAKITIPTGSEGRALISIETGTKILKSFWIQTIQGETPFEFELTKEMSPNIYVNVTLLQKHNQTANDLPIRMYGVIPILVEDPNTKLQPVIEMPDKLESETTVSIKVSEKNNQPMTYTIAIVDEGLLNLTRFTTPNPWDSFFAREALGVKTWDLFSDVIGAYSGNLDKLLAIGGDADFDREGSGKKANRFKPVVIYLGPFTLEKGSKVHKVKIPKYIGAVRTMVVAGNKQAYGSTEKTTPVIKPIMVLGTLPRILSQGETVNLPVSIFAMEDNMKNATVKITTNNLLSVKGSSSKTVSFTEPGEEDVSFEIDVAKTTGVGKVQITATSAGKTSTFEIEIDIRNPNMPTSEVIEKIIEPGQSWTGEYAAIGTPGTNTCILEVSSIPPINLQKRLQYLIQYPHGCVEQTTSAVFPQLYVQELIEVSPERKSEIENNIKAGIKKLMNFQVSSGGFSYWQNEQSPDEWGTNYAGHFLIEAEKTGYAVPNSIMKKWAKYQTKTAKNWSSGNGASQLIQAYRLYTLALAGSPEKASMNRLKETKDLSVAAKWQLAAAYKLSGKDNIAKEMIASLKTDIAPYTELSDTYGSEIRDKAMIVETLTLMNDKAKAFTLLKEISETLSSNKYLSTQTTAYALLAVSKYEKANSKNSGLKYSYTFAGKSKIVATNKSISQEMLNVDTKPENVTVKNTGTGVIYARLIIKGTPDVGVFKDSESNLKMSIVYQEANGDNLTVSDIAQGTDFVAIVSITNTSTSDYKQMALTQIFPAGWEIINPRMTSSAAGLQTTNPTYQDIRDDRVMTYFDLPRGKVATFKIMLNASYSGKYLMPDVQCEAMYDGNIFARKSGQFVNVSTE